MSRARTIRRGILVVNCDSGDRDYDALRNGTIIPLIDAPAAVCAAKVMVALGCQRIEVLVGRNADRVSTLLGDGASLGCELRFHTVPSAQPLQISWVIPGADSDLVWLGTDLCVPRSENLGRLVRRGEEKPFGVAVYSTGPEVGDGHWTGWGCFSVGYLKQLASRRIRWETLTDVLRREKKLSRHFVQVDADLSTSRSLIESQRAVLHQLVASSSDDVNEIEPGVFVASSAHVQAGVTFRAPVYVGADSVIGENAVIGPNAVLSDGTRVGHACTLSNLLVMSHGEFEPDLTVRDAIVDRDVYMQVGSRERSPGVSKASVQSSRIERASLLPLTRPREAALSAVVRKYRAAIVALRQKLRLPRQNALRRGKGLLKLDRSDRVHA